MATMFVNLSPDSRNLANLEAFDYKYFGLAIWQISGNFLKEFGSKFFGLAKMYDLYICIYLLTYSYVDLPFLSSLII